MTKVIIVSTVGLLYDGITNVILSYLKAMDLSDLEIHVVSTVTEDNKISKQIEELGCTIVRLPNRKKDTFKYVISLISYIRKNRIKVIHAHGNSGTLAIEMVCGWIGGCQKRIAHSHNTKCNQIKADKLMRPIFNMFYTDCIACGYDAGKWLFGNKDFTVLSNGRDVDAFKFSPTVRSRMRNKLNINDIAIGHVGAMCEQKNHQFLLKVYKSIITEHPDSKCFIIGDGPLRKEIESEAKKISDNIIFTGVISNVADYLQAMDGMILPSLFEGVPLVVIEWQINGLPCLISDTVTKECLFTDLVSFESLEEEPRVWAEKLLSKIEVSKRDLSEAFCFKAYKAGYDINASASKLKEIYLK